jgi:23S rRNA (uracil1939-C5)-methyltransferase
LKENGRLKFSINAKSFLPDQFRSSIRIIQNNERFCWIGTNWFYDLYTGTGTIAQFVPKNAKKVIGVESSRSNKDAKLNAERNEITTEFFVVVI